MLFLLTRSRAAQKQACVVCVCVCGVCACVCVCVRAQNSHSLLIAELAPPAHELTRSQAAASRCLACFTSTKVQMRYQYTSTAHELTSVPEAFKKEHTKHMLSDEQKRQVGHLLRSAPRTPPAPPLPAPPRPPAALLCGTSTHCIPSMVVRI